MITKLKEDLTAYKWAWAFNKYGRRAHKVIITLRIPKGALVRFGEDYTGWYSTPRIKCRASSAYTTGIKKLNGQKVNKSYTIHSMYSDAYTYKIGKKQRPSGFSHSNEECAKGIHFYKTKKEAIG